MMSLLLAVIMVLSLASGLVQAKVHIQFWHALGGHIGSHVLQQFVDDFNASQDRVHVEAIYQGNYDDTLKYRLEVNPIYELAPFDDRS